jgi:hypothetical protein
MQRSAKRSQSARFFRSLFKEEEKPGRKNVYETDFSIQVAEKKRNFRGDGLPI